MFVLAWLLLATRPVGAADLLVPLDFPTIHAAIAASEDGDSVVVLAGIHSITEPIDFLGKAISVEGLEGATRTTIECVPPLSTAVRFIRGEGRDSRLDGFRIVGGLVSISGSSPTVSNNHIVGGPGAVSLAGIGPDPDGALLLRNRVEQCVSFGPAIYLSGNAVLDSNEIVDNENLSSGLSAGIGGGVLAFASAGARIEIENNLIVGNRVLDLLGRGGGIGVDGDGEVVIDGNTIVENEASLDGGGIYVDDTTSVLARNNIVRDNASPGAEISGTTVMLQVTFSNVLGGYPGAGNFDLDPSFVVGRLGAYYLDVVSGCIDAGDPTTALPVDETTRVDESPDLDVIDVGYHYPLSPRFVRADCNVDSVVDVGDAVFALSTLFVPGSVGSTCPSACDANSDSVVDISDAVFTLTWLFSQGPAPAAPFPGCGSDPTGATAGLPCPVGAACP